MKLIIVRHGDPDYKNNCLTERGKIEAELLADKLVNMPADYYYVSPYGRARETAAPTLERLGREAVVHTWMREFAARVKRPDREEPSIPWNLLPSYWTGDKRYYDREQWAETEVMQSGKTKEEYLWVTGEFDKLLAEHGYVRDGECYRAERPNTETIVMFCHFAVECVFLAHLLGISPVLLWQGTCARTTSITTLVTEERQEGIAVFRMLSYGDVSHLTDRGVEPSFTGRYCEIYNDFTKAH